MANQFFKNTPVGKAARALVDTDALVELGQAFEGKAGQFVVAITKVSGTISVVPKKALTEAVVATTPSACWYTDELAGPDKVAAGTAIAASSIIKIQADGCNVFLDVDVTAGVVQLEWWAVEC